MDDAEIRRLLSGLPASDLFPTPPGMRAIDATGVAAAGADPAEIEEWVTSNGGWARRRPIEGAGALMFIVRDHALTGGPRPDLL
jgi:hypothetical protein